MTDTIDAFLRVTLAGIPPEATDTQRQTALDAAAWDALACGVTLTMVDFLELSPQSRLAFSRAFDRMTQAKATIHARAVATELATTLLERTR
jgi:hypothetical protein